jgi:hypothetical protein
MRSNLMVNFFESFKSYDLSFSLSLLPLINELVDNSARCCRVSKYIFTWIHMAISCSKSEKGSATLSLCVSLCEGMMGVTRRWKGTTTAGGAPIKAREESKWRRGWVMTGESDQCWDDLFITVEGWESGCPMRVAGGGADSILRFWLERGGSGMKRC